MRKRAVWSRGIAATVAGFGLFAAVLPDAPAGASGGPVLTVVATSGQPAPGGGTFTGFSDPVINRQGLVSFEGLLGGQVGLYLGSPTQLQAYAVQGAPAPGGLGYFAAPPGDLNGSGAFPFLPRLDSAGNAYYFGDYYAGGSDLYANAMGLFMDLTKLAASGDPTPDGASFQFDFELADPPLVSPNGTVALVTQLSPCQSNGQCSSGVYMWSQGQWTKVARQGDPTPEGDGTFQPASLEDVMGFGPPSVNDAGQVAFTAHVQLSNPRGGAFASNVADGLYLYSQGALSKLVAQGDALPGGRIAGGFYDVQHAPALNASGAVALQMGTATGSGTPDGSGIYLFSGGSVTPVLHTGDQDPAGSGQVVCSVGTPGLGNDGTLAFTALLGNSGAPCTTGNQVLYVGKPGSLAAVAQVSQGSEVSMQGGALIGPDQPYVNGRGQVAFIVQQQGGARTLEVWNGQAVVRVLGTGDTLNGQSVTTLDLAGQDAQGAVGLNDAGELVFRAFTANGSAIVVTDVNGSPANPALPSWVPTAPSPLSLPMTLNVAGTSVTFPSQLQQGAVGAVGGYSVTGFNFSSGQGVAGIGGADITFGTDSNGNPTLSGTLEGVTPGQSLPAPSSATVEVSPGQLLLVQDSAGQYVLVQVLSANGAAVSFNYVVQQPTATGSGGGSSGSGGSSSGSGNSSGGNGSSCTGAPSGAGSSSGISSTGASNGGSASGSGQTLTVGNSVLTFAGTPATGSIGSGGGYVSTTFDFETGQAGNAIGGGDLQLGFSGNTPALSGTLAVISPGQSVSAPSASTVTATPGETLLVLDSAGRYALVQIERADANGVSFQYWMQSSVSSAGSANPPPTPPANCPSTPNPAPSPAPSPGGNGYPVPLPQLTTLVQSPVRITALPAGQVADQTTVSIAALEFPSGVDSKTVVLSSGDSNHLIDALTAGPLAYHLQAPLLMSASNTELGQDLSYYLVTNHIATVYLIGVLGGPSGSAVAQALKALLPGVQLIPVTGNDRFQTADAIAAQIGTSSTAFVASGLDGHLVDAMAATPAAAGLGAPMLLESPTTPVPAALLRGVSKVYVVGAAANHAYGAVNAQLPNPVAISGATRNQTATLIAQQFFGSATRAIVAPGDDANLLWTLAAAPLAASWGAPLLLAEPGHEDTATQYLTTSGVNQVLVGGSVAQDHALLASWSSGLPG